MEFEEYYASLMEQAEFTYGPKCNDWCFLGIEIDERGPCLAYDPEQKAVWIFLSPKVLDDDIQLISQLSHEVCHLLYPTGPNASATVLNEGLSTLFSKLIFRALDREVDFLDGMKNEENYLNAMRMVQELIVADENAIIKLRKVQPEINKVSANDFSKSGIEVSEELVGKLLMDFS